MSSTDAPRALSAGLTAFGIYQLALGVFMAVAPHSFFRGIGPFGTQNTHYIRDTATYNLALGAVMVLAASRRAWRVPVLAFATLQFALHSVNHLIDIDRANKSGVGPGDFVLLTVMTLLLGWLLRLALAHSPPGVSPSPPAGPSVSPGARP
jgi:hypothetical protein